MNPEAAPDETNDESYRSNQFSRQMQPEPSQSPVAEVHSTPSPYTPPVHPPAPQPAMVQHQPVVAKETPATESARLFLFAYIVSIFSALSVLGSVVYLGYVLFDHFIKDTDATSQSSYFFDMAPIYLSIMTSLMVFGAIYLVSSRYAAKRVADDTVGLKDWRTYRVIYAVFSAGMVMVSAAIIASLLYIPLGKLLIAEDFETRQIIIQSLGGLHALVWIAIFVWQERLVKNGNGSSWLHTGVVLGGIVLIVLLVAIFPIGGKRDERTDQRTVSDLQTIDTAITVYSSQSSSGDLPSSLDNLVIKDSAVKNRLGSYEYTVKNTSPIQPLSQVRGSDSGISMQEYELFNSRSSNSYSVKSYELCATFKTDTTANKTTSSTSSLFGGTLSDSFSYHKKGKDCFQRS